jgi:hypothetical protein
MQTFSPSFRIFLGKQIAKQALKGCCNSYRLRATECQLRKANLLERYLSWQLDEERQKAKGARLRVGLLLSFRAQLQRLKRWIQEFLSAMDIALLGTRVYRNNKASIYQHKLGH